MADWLLALHIIGIILWMGGLFVITRHAGVHTELDGTDTRSAFAEFERKSYYMGVLPGFILTLGSGLWALLSQPGVYLKADGPWGPAFHIKLTLVVLLIAADQFFHFKLRKLHQTEDGSRGLFMGLHGIVGLLFIGIIFVVLLFSPYHGG